MKTFGLVPSRKKLLDSIVDKLEEETSRYIHIFAGRKMGKTLLLKSLEEILKEKQEYIIFYYRFHQGFDKSLDEWIKSIISDFSTEYRLFDDSKEPSIQFERIISELNKSNKVEYPKSIFLLLDDFHWINKNPDFKKFYNYFEKLHDEPNITNFYIIATTLRDYALKSSGGSPFFLKCNFQVNIKPYDVEDLKFLFPECTEHSIEEIKEYTGGNPDIIEKLLNLIKYDNKKLTSENLTRIWPKLEGLVSIKQIVHPLNDDEIQSLIIIIELFDYNKSIKLIDLHDTTKQENKIKILHIKAIKDVGILEESESEIKIVGEIIRRRIQDYFCLESKIYNLINNRLKLEEEFNRFGIKEGKRVFGWISSDQNKDMTSFFSQIEDCHPRALAVEIACLANTASGIICFGYKSNESTIQSVSDEQIKKLFQSAGKYLNILPEYIISSFIIKGKRVGCLLIAKSKEEVLVDELYFIKVEGLPFEFTDVSLKNINPDYFISSRTGFLFIPSVWRSPKDQSSDIISTIPYDPDFLQSESAVNLFIEWLHNNYGEGEMIEFKYQLPEKDTKYNHVIEQIVAMANTKSGVLVIGVEEKENNDFNFISVQDFDREERILGCIESDNRIRYIEGESQRINYNGNNLLLYFIRKPQQVASFDRSVFKRKGGQKFEVLPEDIPRFIEEVFKKTPEGYFVISEIKRWIQKTEENS